ncbi:outer fiber protein [Avian orthoreovirus]|uniref:Outer fiber protein n=1 Tax=Avian orthoreovirus TaxID=38170 RepID=A0A0K0MVX1_9REOV|nr:outer fiber protein [Avian orthoreovirus]
MAALTPSQRREVVGLILSLTSNTNTSCGDLAPLHERVVKLDSVVKSLAESVNVLSQKVSALESSLKDTDASLKQVAASVTELSDEFHHLKSSLSDVAVSVSDMSVTLTEHGSLLTTLQTSVQNNATDVNNLRSSVTALGLTVTDIDGRLKAIESGSSSSLKFSTPLKLDNGVVSLDVDPYFCSNDQVLTSYSADAQLMQFQWLARGADGSSSSVNMLVNAHCHGRRTDYMMSTTENLTVTGNSTALVFNLDYVTQLPTDMSRLIPRAGFQAASFPVDVSFTRDDTTHAYQVYGTFTSPRIFKIIFLTGGTGTANLRFLTVRTGIDT